jgi:hypothetical protein
MLTILCIGPRSYKQSHHEARGIERYARTKVCVCDTDNILVAILSGNCLTGAGITRRGVEHPLYRAVSQCELRHVSGV